MPLSREVLFIHLGEDVHAQKGEGTCLRPHSVQGRAGTRSEKFLTSEEVCKVSCARAPFLSPQPHVSPALSHCFGELFMEGVHRVLVLLWQYCATCH